MSASPSVDAQRSTAAPQVLILSLVHPDFLPSVYALAQVLRERSFAPTILSFSSLASGEFYPGDGIAMIDCGPHKGTLAERRRARARFRSSAQQIFEQLRPLALIATCPFSYLEALRLAKGNRPVIYFVEEIYEVNGEALLHSPLTFLRNWRAERRMRDAALVAAPSDERAIFIGASAGLDRVPATVLNCPHIGEDAREAVDDDSLDALLPARFHGGVLVVNTGRVSSTQGILELVESVASWPLEARLVVTGVDDSEYSRKVRSRLEVSPRPDDICLLPMIPRAAMLALQKRAHVGICLLRKDVEPATRMPAPNKIGEYLKCGMVIVASRLPFLDQLEARNVGELVNEIEPGEIAEAVRRACERVRRATTGAEVQRASREWLNMAVQASPILALLERAMNSERV